MESATFPLIEEIKQKERQIRILERALRLTAETLSAAWGGDVSVDAAIKRYTMLAEEQENKRQ